MSTLQERFIDQIAKTYATCLGTLKAKNKDYTKNSARDPFRNFRNSADFAHVDVDQSILVRISDKLSRLDALTEQGFVAAVDEPIEDTLKDLINYFAILKAWYEMGRPDPEDESIAIEDASTLLSDLPKEQPEVRLTATQKIAELFKKK